MDIRAKGLSTVSEINKKIEASDAYQFEQIIYLIEIHFSFLHGNYQDLHDVLDEFYDPETFRDLMGTEREKTDKMIFEVSRKLINFVAMARALVDTTRNLMNEYYSNSEFIKSYQDCVDSTFLKNPLIEFVEGLRNYALHYKLPIVNARKQMQLKDPELITELSFVLKKSKLLKWKKWGEKGASYLSEQEENIDIEDVIYDYYSVVDNFHKWLHSSLSEFHRNELNWLAAKRLEIEELIRNRREL